jgi:hypothetical protein
VVIYEMFKATGRPDLMQFFVIVRLALIGVLGIPALMWLGLPGICGLVAAANGIVLVLEVFKVAEYLAISFGEFVRALSLPLCMSVVLIPAIYWAFRFNFGVMALGHVAGGILVTVICYASAVFMLDKVVVAEVKKVLFSTA